MSDLVCERCVSYAREGDVGGHLLRRVRSPRAAASFQRLDAEPRELAGHSQEGSISQMATGTVKWFDGDKGPRAVDVRKLQRSP